MTSKFYKIIYKPKNVLSKFIFFLLASILRCIDFLRAFKYDIIFIHLEAYPIGPPVLEFLWTKFGKPIIYDLDDAIYLASKESKYKIVKLFKFSDKIKIIINLAKEIIVCNDYLKKYASNFKTEDRIHIIPTSLDTEIFVPIQNKDMNKNELVIGWIGTHSTLQYLCMLKNVFIHLSSKHNFILKVVCNDPALEIDGVKIINKEWSLSSDVDDFQSLDIGVYPLPDNEWIKGKTGFKTIQYMAVGLPCVVSNLGRNKEIIRDGVNGFLANSEAEWIEKLSLLFENSELRKKMGLMGRETVENSYSLKVNAPLFLELIKRVYNERHENKFAAK